MRSRPGTAQTYRSWLSGASLPGSEGALRRRYDLILSESEAVLSAAVRALTHESIEAAAARLASSDRIRADKELSSEPTLPGAVYAVVSALIDAKMLRFRAQVATDLGSVARLEYEAAMVRVRILDGLDGAIGAMKRMEGEIAAAATGGKQERERERPAPPRPGTSATAVSGADVHDPRELAEQAAAGGAEPSSGVAARWDGVEEGASVAALLQRAVDDAEEVVTGVIAVAHVRASALTLHGEQIEVPPHARRLQLPSGAPAQQ